MRDQRAPQRRAKPCGRNRHLRPTRCRSTQPSHWGRSGGARWAAADGSAAVASSGSLGGLVGLTSLIQDLDAVAQPHCGSCCRGQEPPPLDRVVDGLGDVDLPASVLGSADHGSLPAPHAATTAPSAAGPWGPKWTAIAWTRSAIWSGLRARDRDDVGPWASSQARASWPAAMSRDGYRLPLARRAPAEPRPADASRPSG